MHVSFLEEPLDGNQLKSITGGQENQPPMIVKRGMQAPSGVSHAEKARIARI